jgi:hypothetical protein
MARDATVSKIVRRNTGEADGLGAADRGAEWDWYVRVIARTGRRAVT